MTFTRIGVAIAHLQKELILTPKFIVHCGQSLNVDTQVPVLPGYARIILPEVNGGAEYLRSLVHTVVRLGEPVMFATRFEFVVSEFALLVAEGVVRRDDVLFRLAHNDAITDHYMDINLQFIGDKWPMGVLW